MEGSIEHVYIGILGIIAAHLISGFVVILGLGPVRQMSHQGGLPQVKAVASAEARPCQRFQKIGFSARARKQLPL